GLYGKPVVLNDGRTVVADENYIRESILNPQAKIVRGFGPIMPTFQGQVNEEDLLKLLAYVKSLRSMRLPPTPVESQQSFQTNAGSPLNPGAGVTPQPQSQPATTTRG